MSDCLFCDLEHEIAAGPFDAKMASRAGFILGVMVGRKDPVATLCETHQQALDVGIAATYSAYDLVLSSGVKS